MTVRTKPEAILAPLTGRMAEAIDRDFDVLYQDLAALSGDLPTGCTIGGAYIYRVGGTDVGLADGGTGASLTASAGSVVYSTASALALTAVGATGQLLRSAGTGTPIWTTATYPATTTVSQLLYSSSTNVVGGLATGNSSVLVTNGSGVPAWGTDIPTAVTVGTAYIYRASGTDVAVADGGTGLSSYAVGDIVHATATGTLAGLADVATGRVLASGGVDTVPAYTATPTLTTLTLGAQTLTEALIAKLIAL